MVLVRMRVDDGRHRHVGEPLQLVEHRRAPAGRHRVKEHNPIGRDDGERIRPAVGQKIHLVAQEIRFHRRMLPADHAARRLLCVRDAHGAESHEHCGYGVWSHITSGERASGPENERRIDKRLT